ncbi:MAG: hypothetical protein ACI8UD_002017 [Planctomycetota bacterium]|jgi:hypothetical protein
MTNEGTASLAAPAPPAPPLPARASVIARVADKGSVSFVGMAALGATFVGFLSYGRDPDVLTTSVAIVATFIGTWIALYVLHIALRLTMMIAKVAVPVAGLLLLGCVLDWQWAESFVDWLGWLSSKGAEAADQRLTEWRTGTQ